MTGGRGATPGGLEGLYPILKPPGMTSHDVVAAVRRLTGERHVGHAGTLDPAASGVLLVLVGQAATRLSEYLLDLPKTYLAEVRFGVATDTQDYTGREVSRSPETSLDRLDREAVVRALPGFSGRLEQVPPMVSAVKVGGERLYRLAREGRTVEVPPRSITIYSLELLEFAGAAAAREAGEPLPAARLRVTCSRGTYIRTLAHDLGRALGLDAHLGFLVREAVGPFRLEGTLTLEELAGAAAAGTLERAMVPPSEAVGHLPAIHLGPADVDRVRRGGILDWAGEDPGGLVRVLAPDGQLTAIALLDGGRLRPRKVLRPWNGGRGR